MIDLNSEDIGSDCQGSVYRNSNEMWEAELNREENIVNGISPDKSAKVVNPIGSVESWYSKQADYWEKTEATVNGVLGGFGNLNAPDVADSKKFLTLLQDKHKLGKERVIDCGAGVGRVTKEVLLNFFAKVDLNDQDKKYVEKCKENFSGNDRIGHFIISGIQDLVLTEKYDCIWIQWVSNYLTDKDYLKFLLHCKEHLNPNGLIIVKENIAKVGFIVDKEDSSVTRSDKLFCDLFEKSGLKLIESQMQSNFPKDLFKVKSYALKFPSE